MGRNQRKLKNYLLNRRLQGRYVGLLVLTTLLVYAVLGVLYYRAVRTQDYLVQNLGRAEAEPLEPDAALDAAEAELLAEVDAYLDQESRSLLPVLGGALLVLLLVLAGAGILLSHRAAGPVYAVDRYIHELAAGRLRPMRPLRKGDEFAFLHGSLMRLRDDLVAREQRDIERLTALRAALPGQPDLDAARATLDALIEQKRDRLEA